MLVIISPAKNLNFDKQDIINTYTVPYFLSDSEKLIHELRKLSPSEISALMNVSSKIATLNFERYASWHFPFTKENAKQAILAFNGEVYNGLKASTLTKEELEYAQDHLRILSGLHGVLKPLDLMQAYRLEMGTKLENERGQNLYSFWGDKITNAINEVLKKEKYLINLASNEYYKSIDSKKINGKIITPVFKQMKGDAIKMIVIYAKKARGLMSRYIIKNRIENIEELKLFDYEGYFYNEDLSTENEWVFVR